MDKQALRKTFLARRDALSPTAREDAARRLAAHLTQSPQWQQAKHIFIFLAFGSELPTQQLIEAAWQAGKHVYLPVTQPERQMVAACYTADTPMRQGAFGLLEIVPDAIEALPPEDIDLCLIPGVIFDRFGGRIGYGGGYYDRFLLRLHPDCARIAIALHVQLSEEALPLEATDVLIPLLLTEEGWIHTQTKNA